MASKNINLIVVNAESVTLIGNPFVVTGSKASQPDDPSYVDDFATFEEALAAYNACTYPLVTIEYYPPT